MSNIYDIAKISGVSRSTVSRVLNNSPNVNEKTRRQVLAVIEQLGYTPNVAARSLARRKTYVLGIVSDSLFTPYSSKLAGKIVEAVSRTDYTTVLCPLFPGRSIFRTLFGKVDGIIELNYNSLTVAEKQEFIDGGIPVVSFDNKTSLSAITEVSIDNYYSSYKATEYLIRQGHRRIGHIYGAPYFTFDERLEGYRKALEDNGLPFREEWVMRGDNIYRTTYERAYQLIGQDLTAIFAGSDIMALGYMKLAAELDIRVPEDVSIIGFDDISNDSYYFEENMDITTLRQPMGDIAGYIVEAMLHLLDKGEKLPNKAFVSELVRLTATVRRVGATR